MFSARNSFLTAVPVNLDSPIDYVTYGSTTGNPSQTWNFNPNTSSCVVVGLTAIAYFGNGDPTLTTATFNGTALTIIKDKYLTNYEPNSTNPSVYSWLLGITGSFTNTNYPIVINVTNMFSGGGISATALSFSGPVTGFANAASAGGAVVPSSTTTATVTINSAKNTTLIGYGARQANSPSLSGGTLRVSATNGGNTRSQMSHADNTTSQTFSTTGGAVSGCALTW